jgi:diguanylate cyclase (GGDEF)-like protein
MKLRLNFNSITTRLILFGLAIVIASSFGRIFFLSNYLRKDLTELASAQLLTLANYVGRDIDNNIVERRDLLKRVGVKLPLALLGDPGRLQFWLNEHHEINPVFSHGYAVLDTAGKALVSNTALFDKSAASFADRDYFLQAMKGEFAIGRPFIAGAGKAPLLPMAIPVRNTAGKVIAILVGVTAFDTPGFLESLQSANTGSAGGLVLVSPRDKIFIAATDVNLALKPTPNEGAHHQHDQAMQGFRGVGIDVDARGIEELAAIASIPSSGWFVVARMPTSEVFAPLTRLRQFIVSNTALVALFFLLVVVTFLHYLLRPLKNAAQYADRMTRGEIPLEPLPVVRNDEVGNLTLAFNRVLSKLLESRSALEHSAQHDVLTGLPNRQLLADRMKQALARARRTKGQLALMFFDLDGFKPINDELGHEAGDLALCEVSARLQMELRREDTLARVGGDEFVILLSDLGNNAKSAAESVADKCLEVFMQPYMLHGKACRIGTSIGIVIGDGECTPDKLLIAADQAMYKAKQAGGGQYLWSAACKTCSMEEGRVCSIHSISFRGAQQ